jgi:hypothetical protein
MHSALMDNIARVDRKGEVLIEGFDGDGEIGCKRFTCTPTHACMHTHTHTPSPLPATVR